jgi:hypothetical protein
MKELSVFAPLKRVADFCSDFPIDRPLFHREVEGVHSQGAQPSLEVGKGTPLLQDIKQVDEDAAVFLTLGTGRSAS